MNSKTLLISKPYLPVIFLLFNSFYITAQTTRQPVASAYTGLTAYSFNQTDVFSFSANQASLAEIKKITAGVFSEKRFLLNELGFYQLAVAIPSTSGNFGLSTRHYGFSEYTETVVGLAYARKLGDRVNIGAQFNYYSVRISGYGNASAVTAELGTVFKITDKFFTGFHVFNPAGGKFGKNGDEKLASVYTAGFGYEASEKFFVGAEIVKEENQPVNVSAGVQYRPLPKLISRAGISASASVIYFGVGIPLNKLRLDATAAFHQQLGVSPGLLLVYEFNSKDD